MTVEGHSEPPPASPLADCHTHLDTFPPKAVPDMLARAVQAGVNLIVTAGLDLASSRRAIALAATYPTLYAAVGLHPLYLSSAVREEDFASLRVMATAPKVVAISEVGLDYEKGRAPRAIQMATFRRLVRLAVSLRRPIIFHDRGAHDDIFRVLREERAGGVGIVMHYFTEDVATARRCLDLGGYISLGKPITKPDHAALRDVVRLLPMERILLETDAYWRPERGEAGQTEPWQVSLVAAQVAAVKGVSIEEVGCLTSANLCRLLGIGSPGND